MRPLFPALAIALAVTLASSDPPARAQQTASGLFEALRAHVHQVRVIDVVSGDKTSIGSGFRVDGAGRIATNFHVVSLAIHEPGEYRLELDGPQGETLSAEVVAIDVLNDLAILETADAGARREGFLPILAEPIAKGERIYSMGNPRDLGMTIIEGNYNGLVKTSRFERMLFSGSLNPGMSGGPAFNDRGQVIGVNVSTGGEQISFLVPGAHLEALLRRARREEVADDFRAVIRDDLWHEQATFYGGRIADDWESEAFGELSVPKELSPEMKCWGHNVDEEDDVAYTAFHQHCRSEEYLYIEEDFYTGNFAYDYEWMTTESLNPLQFYAAVQERFTHAQTWSSEVEDLVSEYACLTDFVDLDGTSWKASLCLRRYEQYEGLHDASLVMASLRANDRAAVVRMQASGIGRRQALDIFRKLMSSIRWPG